MVEVATVGIALVAAAPAPPIQAGRWKVTIDMREAVINGQSRPGMTGSPISACLTPESAMKGPGLALPGSDRCTVVSSSLTNDTFAYEMECKPEEGRGTAVMKTHGTFDAISYKGETETVQKRPGLTVIMRGSMQAKRTGDC